MSNGSKYYGGFFWVAVVSFIVPIFVGWKAFENVSPTTKPIVHVDQLDKSGVDHKLWDYLLKTYVSNGLVDYDGMKKDYLFYEYLRELGSCDPQLLETEDARLALACNAYNAFVINGVIKHKIHDKVTNFSIDEVGFFNIREHLFAGQTISADDLEQTMIRPTFKEPRIHVALVCAARGCPSIRPEAYTGDRVRDQLQDQSILFVNNPKHVMFDPSTNELKVSMILSDGSDGKNNWGYFVDWDERYPNGGYKAWIAELARDATLKAAAEQAIKGEVNVSFLKYDWTLNSQADPKAGPSKKKKSGGFGSGSSPDE